MYHTWGSQKELKENFAEMSKAGEDFCGISKANLYGGRYGRESVNVGNNTTIRSGFNRADYNYYRSHEAIPTKVEDSISECDKAYYEVSIVRSIIDMMSDFTVQGIRIEHRDPQIQNFMNDWSDFVDFHHVSERIGNTLYRIANCPVKIAYGKVPIKTEREWKQSNAADVSIENKKVLSNRIPLKYNILNPLNLEVIGGDLAAFIGKPVYGFKPSFKFQMNVEKFQHEKKEIAGDLLKVIPEEMREKILNGTSLIPIDPENLEVLFYKKDDWKTWSVPMVHSILKPLYRLGKMHLAEDKALDGAISQIRLWRLGSFEYKIYPTSAAINKLRNTLANIGSGDVMDIIWGPELDFKESESKAYNFLKQEKYSQVMTEIYAGLGVPSSLTGGDSKSGLSNNAISMRTLIERLEYGRRVIKRFWENQFKILQKAMGWKYPPVISFDYKVLGDEQAEKKLLLDLWDRDLISDERIQELSRQNPKLETIKINKDMKKRKAGKKPPKASPYHNPNIEQDLKKIILQNGGVAPSEVGLDLREKKEGEQTKMELDQEAAMESMKEAAKLAPKPAPGGSGPNTTSKDKVGKGRPSGTKDSVQRKRKDKGKTSVAFIDLFNWANDAQDSINDIMSPFILNHFNKANLRSLNKSEVGEFERLKFYVLSNLDPHNDFDGNTIKAILSSKERLNADILLYKEVLIKKYSEVHDKSPTTKELRQIQSSSYATLYED